MQPDVFQQSNVQQKSGGLVKATDFNPVVDAIRGNGRPSASGGSNTPRSARSSPTRINVQNQSGTDFDQYHAVIIEANLYPADAPGSETSPTKTDLAFLDSPAHLIDMPSTNTGYAWGILQQPVKNQDKGIAVVFGLTKARVNILSVGDTHADIKSGSSVLQSGPTGQARIIYVKGWETTPGTAASTGEQWADVLLGYKLETVKVGGLVRIPNLIGYYIANTFADLIEPEFYHGVTVTGQCIVKNLFETGNPQAYPSGVFSSSLLTPTPPIASECGNAYPYIVSGRAAANLAQYGGRFGGTFSDSSSSYYNAFAAIGSNKTYFPKVTKFDGMQVIEVTVTPPAEFRTPVGGGGSAGSFKYVPSSLFPRKNDGTGLFINSDYVTQSPSAGVSPVWTKQCPHATVGTYGIWAFAGWLVNSTDNNFYPFWALMEVNEGNCSSS